MLEIKLTTCANLLYQWLLPRTTAGSKLKIDLQDFQAWTAEYREKPFSDRDILDAVRQLKELQLIKVSRTEVTLEVKPQDYLTFNTELATQILLADKSEQPNRWLVLGRIIAGCLLLGLTAVTLGLAVVQVNPNVLTLPNAWSVLGEKNIGSGN